MTRRIFSFILLLYPADYRKQFAAEMLAVFDQAAEECWTRRRGSYGAFLACELTGLLAGAAAECSFLPLLLWRTCGAFVALQSQMLLYAYLVPHHRRTAGLFPDFRPALLVFTAVLALAVLWLRRREHALG